MTTSFDSALAAFQLGSAEIFLKLDGIDQFHAAQTTLLAQCKHTLFITTLDFEAERFNNDGFADALSAFARSSRFTDTRILVGDPAIAVRWGHRVVKLAQRLSSKILIRQLHEEDQEKASAVIVADHIGLLRRDTTANLTGMIASKSIPHAQRAHDKFIEQWERAHEISDFRNLHI